MTKPKRKIQISAKRKQELDWFIRCTVKEGYLDEDRAEEMSYEEKDDYFEWSDAQANK